MILTAAKIKQEVENGNIIVTPFNEAQIGPNSYDVTLSNILKTYAITPLDMRKPNETREIIIPEEGFILQPNTLYLASTNEKIGSDFYLPILVGRSSLARLGITAEISAGFGDLGFKTNWTLELSCLHPVRIYPNVKIAQIYFNEVSGNVDKLYTGKYIDQTTPTESQLYKDFK
jgi:dCTP deaminase